MYMDDQNFGHRSQIIVMRFTRIAAAVTVTAAKHFISCWHTSNFHAMIT